MNAYQIKINLLSDLCVSDGGVFNSFLDMDICYDDLGFPYIPAKRLRGCLRECALELNDWGKQIPIEEIFGGKGDIRKGAAFRLEDAVLEDYQQMRKSLQEGHILFHPQNILNHFSYIRTQTSINYDTGAAEENSLRTMRVAKKGLVFVANLQLPEKYEQDMRECCAVLKHMGNARTRGLGQVQVSLEPVKPPDDDNETNMNQFPWKEGSDILYYRIQLEEPLICKSVAGGESNSLDYISGSQVLGLLLSACDEDSDKKKILDGTLYCANAYIEMDGERGMEIPAYFSAVKNEKHHFVNELIPRTEKLDQKQINAMKHCYATIKGDKLFCKDVSMIERYHHRRPEDKSFGRATEEASGDSMFYQISSIGEGQTFIGYIQGDTEQIKIVYDLLSKETTYYMGYSHHAEYGKVRLEIVNLEQRQKKEPVRGEYLLVNVLSPTIVYNNRAFYSTDASDLLEEIYANLEIHPKEDLQEPPRKFIKYTTLGGYNVTWNMRKPIIQAFDKGTAVLLHLREKREYPGSQILLLGERHQEGYGEISVQCLEHLQDYLQGDGDIIGVQDKTEMQTISNPTGLACELCEELYQQFVRVRATESAKENEASYNKKKMKPTVSNMLLMCKESSGFEEVRNSVQKRYQKASVEKQEKEEVANQIIKDVEEGYGSLAEQFAEKYRINGYQSDRKDMEKTYLYSYLLQLKYMIREREKREEGEYEQCDNKEDLLCY